MSTTKLRTCRAARLQDYAATELHRYTPTHIAAYLKIYLPFPLAGECDSVFLKLSRRRLSSSSS